MKKIIAFVSIFTMLMMVNVAMAKNPSSLKNCKSSKIAGLIVDKFNSYNNGSIIGQGGWINRVNGINYVIQESVTCEGLKALYNNSQADSVVTKTGNSLSDGLQVIYMRTENRASWGTYNIGENAQVRISKGSWDSLSMVSVALKKDGNASYYDPATDSFVNFDTYKDSEWTRIDIEWRSNDKTARYRINNRTWTGWETFRGASSFTNFDTVGFDFISPGGSGGIYIDNLN